MPNNCNDDEVLRKELEEISDEIVVVMQKHKIVCFAGIMIRPGDEGVAMLPIHCGQGRTMDALGQAMRMAFEDMASRIMEVKKADGFTTIVNTVTDG